MRLILTESDERHRVEFCLAQFSKRVETSSKIPICIEFARFYTAQELKHGHHCL